MGRPAGGYSQEQKEYALQLLARNAGNALLTARLLNDHPWYENIQKVTLLNWKERNEKLYRKYANECSAEIEGDLARNARELAYELGAVQRKAVHKTDELLEWTKDAGVAAKATHDLAKAGAVNTDKMLTLTGRPTQIQDTRTARQILEGLAAKGLIGRPSADVDGEAEEVPAELEQPDE